MEVFGPNRFSKTRVRHFALVEGRVEVEEIREETACRYFASQPIKVVVPVFGQITYAALLLPDLDGEDGRLAIAHASISGFQ